MKLTLEQQKKGQEIYNEIVKRAWESEEFKTQLMSNPESTISEVLGGEFKGKVVVSDQTDPDTIYINLPRKVNIDELELSDEQLEMVSGGESVFLIAAGIGFVAGIAFTAAAAGVAAALK